MAVDNVRAANWSGSIPVVLSLAPTSLSSPTIPAPIHVVVSRHTFLHVGLQGAVFRLHKYAPPTFSFSKRIVEEPATMDDSGTDNADDEKEKVGTTRASSALSPPNESESTSTPFTASDKAVSYPLCWFEDEATQLPLQWQLFVGVLWDTYGSQSTTENGLPWKLRLHFSNYPSSQLLELDTVTTGLLATVERTFKNSLKQALVLQHGQNKVALNMTKQTHQRIWDSIVTSKYSVYKPIQEDIQVNINSQPVLIPIRLVVGPSKPLIQKRCDDVSLSLGQLLHLWLPQDFEKREESGDDVTTIRPISKSTQWVVAGVSPPLSTPVIDLWQSLCHPDNFLYVAIVRGS